MRSSAVDCVRNALLAPGSGSPDNANTSSAVINERP
jgi:hypothetical protein